MGRIGHGGAAGGGRVGKAWWRLAAACALCCVVGALAWVSPTLAGGEHSKALSGESGRTWPSAALGGSASRTRLLRLSKARSARRRRWLESPQAQAQRTASRTGFHGLDAAASMQLLQKDFGSRLAGVSANPAASLAAAGSVVRYLGDNRALVRTAHGLSFETSSVPLRVGRPGESERPVDLSLRQTASAFAAANPLQAVSVSRRLSGGVAVGSAGIRVIPQGTDVAGDLIDGQDVFFADVGTDEDAVISPTIRGADLSTVLRSQMSPERIVYHVALPSGATLRAADGGALIVRDGKALARLSEPVARDAQGTAVPVTMEVSGDEIVVMVALRGRSVDYPVLVDPEVVTITKSSEHWTFEGSGSHTPPSEGSPMTVEQGGTYPEKEPCYAGVSECGDNYGGGTWVWEIESPFHPADVPVNFTVEFNSNSFSGSTSPEHSEDARWQLLASCIHGFEGWVGKPPAVNETQTGECAPFSGRRRKVEVGVATGQYKAFGAGEYVPQVTASASLSVGSVLVSESLPSSAPYEEPGAETYGPSNEGEPRRNDCYRGEVNCATGNHMTTQTDLEVGGRGPGLELARTYNSQLAVAQGERGKRGPFGYGWTSSYSAHLAIGAGLAFVRQDDGSTVSFLEGEGGHFTPVSPLVQATLKRAGSNFLYTLADQTTLTFNEEGVLTSEADRNGNTITLIYEKVSCSERGQADAFVRTDALGSVHPDAAGGGGGEECPRLAAIEDAAKRKITLKYNEQGLVETTTDPMGRKVNYEYSEENLTDVTEPGESTTNWQFKYDSSHQLTSQTEAPGHTTTVEYNGAHRVTKEVDPMSHERTWEYTGSEASPETHIKEPNGAVTVVKANLADLLTSSTAAFGTSIAAKSTYEYNGSDDLVVAVDPNGHETKYGYDAEGNRTSETNADGDETIWTYDSTHDVDTITTPDGETTTIKRDSHGNPEVIERPAPSSSTQKTTYKYDTYGDVESKTNPTEHTWKYEYDGYGDRKSEVDPEGNKRTWEYNEDSQEVATVSPRGNVEGGEPAKFTTRTERDARGRAAAVTEPETNSEVKPTNKVQATISGTAQERQTLTAGAGIWEGTPSLTYTYQWEYCNASGGSCSNISGATSATYVLGATYVGDTLRVVVTTTNSAGSGSSTSEATATVSSVVPVFSLKFGSKGTAGGQVDEPKHDAVDARDNVWVADSANHRIEEFSSTGTFMLAVGWGVKDGKAEAETCITSCQAGISGTGSGQFEDPFGIAISQSSGNIYVADYLADRIEEISSTGAYVASFGTKGSAGGQFSSPQGVAIDASGNVWVADGGNNRIQELSSSGSFMLAIGWGVKDGKSEAETCTASCQAGISGLGNGQLATPTDTAFSGGNVYVSDYGNDRVDEFSAAGAYVSKFGSKGTGAGQFEGAHDIATEPGSGNLYVVDRSNDRVEEFTAAGTLIAMFGSKGTGNGQLELPSGVAVNPTGGVYVTDGNNNRVEEWELVSSAPVFASKFGSVGSENGELKEPRGVAITASSNIDVLDTENDRVEEFSSSGTYVGKFGSVGKEHGEFESPRQIAIDSKGNIWVADTGNDRVQEFNEKREFQLAFGSEGTGNGQFKEPKGLATAPNGDVYVSDIENNRVEQFNTKGEFLATFGFGVSDGKAEFEICTSSCKAGISGSGNGQFNQPVGVAVGANGDVWVVDYGSNRVEEFNEKDEYLSQFGSKGTGNGQFDAPKGVAIGLEGNVWVVDGLNYRVQEFTPSETFLTTFGSKGTGNGQFEEPYGIALTANGLAYIADIKNNRIDAWRQAGTPSGTTQPSISGELLVGQTLSASTGTWSAVPSPTYTYQWQHCNSSGESCSNISGATGPTYFLSDHDVGYTIRVVVTATNTTGSASGTSAATEVIPHGPTTEYAYGDNGNIETQTDPNGNTTKHAYNADNQETKTEEPNKATTETEYDAMGQVTTQADGNKHTTEYKRNLLEETTEESNPLGHKTKKEYDAAGNLVKLTDPKGRTTTYTYDHANRLTEVSYSSGNPSTVKYEYNKDGDRTKMTDGTGSTNYTYDQLDRLTETENGHKEVIKYEYNLANEQTKITYPNGKAVTRAFDKDSRLEKVTDWNGKETKFSYDPNSDLKATTFPSETKDEDKYTYNGAGEMSEVKMLKGAETLASLVYTRDKDGHVKTTTSKGLPGEEKPTYEYDSDSRLTKGAGIAYEYDSANNPTKIGSGTYKYNSGNELETGPSLTYAYDEDGERTKTKPSTGPATTYGYDQAGNLLSVERPKEGETSEIKDSYAYNGDGLRVSQTISGTTTYMAWDMAEKLPLLLSDGTNSYIYGPEGLPIEQISSGGTTSYLHHDQQGSTRLLTGSAGTVTGKCTYNPYGTPTCEGTATTPLGFDGQYISSDTGLIYLRAREYDPATAQFLSVDPEVQQTAAPYSYAGDNPVSLGDPFGLTPWSPKIKKAQSKCQSWKAWHSERSPYYGDKNTYYACQDLLHLPAEVYGTGNQGGGSITTGTTIAVACGLSGAPVALITRGVSGGPAVAGAVSTFCVGYAVGELIVDPLLHGVAPSVFPE
jgi:RHS repeat-associated protein